MDQKEEEVEDQLEGLLGVDYIQGCEKGVQEKRIEWKEQGRVLSYD